MVITTRRGTEVGATARSVVAREANIDVQTNEIKTQALLQCVRSLYVTLNLSKNPEQVIRLIEKSQNVTLTRCQKCLIPTLMLCFDEDIIDCSDQLDTLKTIRRDALKRVRSIQLPSLKGKRTAGTRKEFVNTCVVYIAYLIISSDGSDSMATRFELSDQKDKDLVVEEIKKSKFPYKKEEEGFKYNNYVDAQEHVKSKSLIGPWITNTKNKFKKYGSWHYDEVQKLTVGDTNGLFEPYKVLLEEVGVQFS